MNSVRKFIIDSYYSIDYYYYNIDSYFGEVTQVFLSFKI